MGIALANARLHVCERAISTELQAANATLTDTVSALQAWAGPSPPPVPYPKDPTGQRQEDLERAHRHQDAVRSKGRLTAAAGWGGAGNSPLQPKYGLHRIGATDGLDLADPDTAFNLQLSARGWQTLAALREL